MSDARRRSFRRRDRARMYADVLERLESRVLLAATDGVFDIGQVPVFAPTTTDIHDVKNGPMAVAGPELINLYLDYRRAVSAGRTFDAKTVASGEPLNIDPSGKVGVTLRTRGDFTWFVKKLTSTWGFETTSTIPEFTAVQGYLPVENLRTLAIRSDVAQMTPIYKPILRRGSANNQGDAGQRSNTVRTTYGVDGTGVKVGVLSDSVNRVDGGRGDSEATGDLPTNVQVLRDSFGTDEGRAMLEEIYDIAPGASLAFASANGGQSAFANSIDNFRRNQVNVAVDDIGYPDEPFFQPGVLETAIRNFKNNGGIFVSASGNVGNSGFQQDAQYLTVAAPTPTDPTAVDTFIDFNPSATATARRMTITLVDGGDMSFEWDNPWTGVVGNATADLDIRFYTPGTNTVVRSGLSNNLTTRRPVEVINNIPAGTYEVEIQVEDLAAGASNPTLYRFMGDVGMTTTQFVGTRSTVLGHSASVDVISVGAVNFFSAPPVDNTPPIPTASYSALGPGTYVFDANGNRLATRLTTQKPDFAGIDGVNTSFFDTDAPEDTDTLPNFFGTSAAAPNVAAGIALLRQLKSSLTQAQAFLGLKATARPVNGTAAGVWDSSGGWGLVDFAATIPIISTAPTVDIVDVIPDPTPISVDAITIKFDQRVTGFSRGDLKLTLNGGSSNLLTSGQPLTTSDNVTFLLSNLAPRTGADGTYQLVLTAAGSNIENLSNQALTTNATETWTKITPPPRPKAPTNFSAIGISAAAVELKWDDISSNEFNYQVVRALDAGFNQARKTFTLAASTTSFTDETVRSATKYFYHVRATNVSGAGRYSDTVDAATLVAGEVVVDSDSRSARVSGPWKTGTSGQSYVGDDYLTLPRSAPHSSYVRYVPSLLGNGNYFIYARWPRLKTNASNTQFEVFFGVDGAEHTIFTMDQRGRGGAGWVLVGGPYLMERGTGAGARIRNIGANGNVIADAVRFLPGGPIRAPIELAGKTKALHFRSHDEASPASPFNDDEKLQLTGTDDLSTGGRI